LNFAFIEPVRPRVSQRDCLNNTLFNLIIAATWAVYHPVAVSRTARPTQKLSGRTDRGCL